MRNDKITLITRAYTNDAYGIARDTQTTTDIYCDVKSITQSEFFAAANAGLKPSYRFDVFAHDYNGATLIQYGGDYYSVYRTYQQTPDVLELYVQKNTGV